MSTNINWSREWKLNEELSFNFNNLIPQIPSNGLEMGTKGDKVIFNLDDAIGAGHKKIGAFGGAYIDPTLLFGYNYGLKLDLGQADANIKAGVEVGVNGPLNDLNLKIDFDNPTLNWRLKTPSARVWAYAFYELGADIDLFYDLGWFLPSAAEYWVKKYINISDRWDFWEPSTGRRYLGTSFNHRGDYYSGRAEFDFDGGGAPSKEVISEPKDVGRHLPAWTRTLLPSVNLSLFHPVLPKLKTSANQNDGVGFSLESKFPIVNLNADVAKYISAISGIPLKQSFGLGFEAVGADATLTLLGLDTGLDIDGHFDVDMNINIPNKIDIYNAESGVTDNKKLIGSIITSELETTNFSEIRDKVSDENKNGNIDLELKWEPTASLQAKLGYKAQAYLDWEFLRLNASYYYNFGLWEGSDSKTFGPMFGPKRTILGGTKDFTYPLNTGKIDIGSKYLPQYSVPVSIPLSTADVIRGILFDSGDRVQLLPETKEFIQRYGVELDLDSNFRNLTISKPDNSPAGGINLKIPTVKDKNRNFTVNDKTSNENIIKLSENIGGNNSRSSRSMVVDINRKEVQSPATVDSLLYFDEANADTEILSTNKLGSLVADLGDGNDLFRGISSRSLISFGEGNDDFEFIGDNDGLSLYGGVSSSFQEERQSIAKEFHSNSTIYGHLIDPESTNPVTFFDFGRGSDSVNGLSLSGTEVIMYLDNGHQDSVRIGENSSSANTSSDNIIRLAGTDDSAGQTDEVQILYSNENLSTLKVNHTKNNRSANVDIDGSLANDRVILDYSEIAGSGNGVNLVLNGNKFNPHTTTNRLWYQFIGNGYPLAGYEVPGPKIPFKQVEVVGSRLNDVFRTNSFVAQIQGLSGDDAYILDSDYFPSYTRRQSQDDGKEFSDPFDEDISQNRASFIYDPAGKSHVAIKDGALESFYRHGEHTINTNTYAYMNGKNSMVQKEVPAWTLDLSELTEAFDSSKTYSVTGSNIQIEDEGDYHYNGNRENIQTDLASEIILTDKNDTFWAGDIWKNSTQMNRIDDFTLMYRTGDGIDRIRGFADVDVFELGRGTKFISDDRTDDHDGVIINRSIDTVRVKASTQAGYDHAITFTDSDDIIHLKNIEDISIRYDASDDENLHHVHFESKDLFDDPPILIRGIPEAYIGGKENIEDQMRIFVNVITDRSNDSKFFGYNKDGSLTISKTLFTSRLLSMDGEATKLKFNSQKGINVVEDGNRLIISKSGGFDDQSGDPYQMDYTLTSGDREFKSTVDFVFMNPTEVGQVSVMDQNGAIKTDKGTIIAKVGKGVINSVGASIQITDKDGDGKITGADLQIDVNEDGKLDTIPKTDVVQSGILSFDVDLEAKQDSTTLDIQLPNPVEANMYRKYYDGQWNEFLYDPKKPKEGGAKLIDANGDGLIEKIKLYLIDGGAGDADDTKNGTIVDPGIVVKAKIEPDQIKGKFDLPKRYYMKYVSKSARQQIRDSGIDINFRKSKNWIKFNTKRKGVIKGSRQDDLLSSANKKPSIFNDRQGDDIVIGNISQQTYKNGRGNDILIGSGKRDIFEDGKGNDLMIAVGKNYKGNRADRDLFKLGRGMNNIIADFDDKKDKFRILAGGEPTGYQDTSYGAFVTYKGGRTHFLGLDSDALSNRFTG